MNAVDKSSVWLEKNYSICQAGEFKSSHRLTQPVLCSVSPRPMAVSLQLMESMLKLFTQMEELSASWSQLDKLISIPTTEDHNQAVELTRQVNALTSESTTSMLNQSRHFSQHISVSATTTLLLRIAEGLELR